MVVASFQLSSGFSLPAISFGTYTATETQRPNVKDWTLTALKEGYRSIDTAWTYGTEKYVGDAIRESGVPRDAIFLTTKVYIHFIIITDNNRWNQMHKNVRNSAELSLRNLGDRIEYIDLLLLHCDSYWSVLTC